MAEPPPKCPAGTFPRRSGRTWPPMSALIGGLIRNLGDPLVIGEGYARRWLQFTANIGRAPNTITASGRALKDHLRQVSLPEPVISSRGGGAARGKAWRASTSSLLSRRSAGSRAGRR